MRPYFNRKKLFLIPVFAAAFIALVGFVVMTLWNALIPAIFHLGVISFWQAAGIFLLCKILFGFGHGNHGWRGKGPWMRRRMEERFKNMTPEEREKFKAKWDEKCGHDRWGHHRHGFQSFGDEWTKKAPETEQTAE